MTAMLLLACLPCAPAPLPRPAPPAPPPLTRADLLGEWLMSWGQPGGSVTTFTGDGRYHCRRDGDGRVWVGAWRLERGTLYMDESWCGADWWGGEWGVALRRDGAALVWEWGTPKGFSLRRAPR
jgi:hypothetical protein